MHKLLLSATLLSFVFWGIQTASAGIVLRDAENNEIRYSNEFDGSGNAFHGRENIINTLASERWYVWVQSPIAFGGGTAQGLFELGFDVSGTVNAAEDQIEFQSITQVGASRVNVSINYTWSEPTELKPYGEVTSTVNLDVAHPGSSGATVVRVFNLFDYDARENGGTETVTAAGTGNSQFEFFDSLEPDAFAVRTMNNPIAGFDSGIVNPTAPGIDGSLSGGSSDPSGGFVWERSFSSSGSTSFSSSFSAVPEPSSLLYATLFGLVAIGRRRRRA